MAITDVLYQNSDQKPQVIIYDTDGVTQIPASTYLNATYNIFEAGTCTSVLSKTLGAGITVNGDNFEIEISVADIPFYGIDGEYTHQFRVGTTVSEELPPYFDRAVDIIKACEV